MKLFICDLEIKNFQKIFHTPLDDIMIILDDNTIHHCIGCFGCWIKTPATCVIQDKYRDMGEYMSKCREVVIVSKCCYGGFSPFVKNVLDRSISYVHTYFKIKNGEMHHRRRYKNHVDMQVWFYGEDITEKERQTAQNLIKANSINLDFNISKVKFVSKIEEMEGEMLWK